LASWLLLPPLPRVLEREKHKMRVSWIVLAGLALVVYFVFFRRPSAG